jgi:hypothetical protein
LSLTLVALSAAKLCAVLFCWSVTVLLCLLGSVVLLVENGQPDQDRPLRAVESAIGYTIIAVIVFGAGMFVLGVLGWVGSVLLATAVETAAGGLRA